MDCFHIRWGWLQEGAFLKCLSFYMSVSSCYQILVLSKNINCLEVSKYTHNYEAVLPLEQFLSYSPYACTVLIFFPVRERK